MVKNVISNILECLQRVKIQSLKRQFVSNIKEASNADMDQGVILPMVKDN